MFLRCGGIGTDVDDYDRDCVYDCAEYESGYDWVKWMSEVEASFVQSGDMGAGSSTVTSDGTETGGTVTRTGASTETGTNTGTGGATTTTTTNGSNTTRLTTSATRASRSTSLGSSASSTNATTAVPLPLESGSSPVFVMGGSIGGGVDEAYAIYAANSPLVLMSGDAAGERAYFSVLPNTTMVDVLNTSRIIYLHFIPAHARIGKRQSNQGIYAMQYGHISDFMKRDTPDILSGYNLDPEKGVSCTGPDGKELSVVLAGGDSEGKGVGMALPDADYGTISVSSFVQQVATVSVAVNPDGGFSISQAPLSTPAAVAASVASASSASVASVASVSSASIASVASASSASVASVSSRSSSSSSSSSTTRATGPDAYDIITSNSLQAYCYTLLAYIPKATTVTTEGTTTLPQYTKSTTVSRTAATPGGDSTVKYTALSATTTVFSDLPRRRRARRSKSGETYTKNPDPTIITKRQNNAPTALSNYATSQLSSACSRAITSPTSVRTLTATTYVTSYTPATGVSTIFTTVATTTSVFLISTPVSTIPISTYLPGSSYLKVGGTSAWRNYYLGKLAAVDSYGSVARGWASTDVTSASRFSFLYSKNTGEYRLSMTDTTTTPATDLQLWTNITNGLVM
ncbi:hypothetical protein TWF173_011382 [Orbilia oligospora]|nr:hypothetical protein TWF173_011382 [Orbilia oligospora]